MIVLFKITLSLKNYFMYSFALLLCNIRIHVSKTRKNQGNKLYPFLILPKRFKELPSKLLYYLAEALFYPILKYNYKRNSTLKYLTNLNMKQVQSLIPLVIVTREFKKLAIQISFSYNADKFL